MQPGEIIADKFRVERLLGEGGMGVVVVATHLKLDQTVALKFLHDNIAWDAGVIERLMREARASAKLKTEHVCRVMDVGQLPTGTPYIVMELLDGHDLSSVIRRAPLSPAVAAEYVLQACVAIAEAHAAGIVHRDLKPSNMFVTERLDGTPLIKVLDFGIAKAQAKAEVELTRTAAVMGSPGYMSPEQLRSAKDVDARTDIWSLGVILYEAVSGKLPFRAETITELAVKVSMDPYEPLATDPSYAAIVARCLEKPVANRYQSVAELAIDLARIAGAKGTTSATMIARLSGQRPAVVAPASVERTPVGAIAATLPSTAPDAPFLVEPTTPERRDKTPLLPPSTTLSNAAGSRAVAAPSSKKPIVFAGVGLVVAGGIAAAVIAGRSSQQTATPPAASGSTQPAVAEEPELTTVSIRVAAVADPGKVTLSYGPGNTKRAKVTRVKRAIDLPTRVVIGVQGTGRFLNKAMLHELGAVFGKLRRSDANAASKVEVLTLGKRATFAAAGGLGVLESDALGTPDKYKDEIVFAEASLSEMMDGVGTREFEGRTLIIAITSPTTLAEATANQIKRTLAAKHFELHYITIEGDDEPSPSPAALVGDRARSIKKPGDLPATIDSITTRIAAETAFEFEVERDIWRKTVEATIEIDGHARAFEVTGKKVIQLDAR